MSGKEIDARMGKAGDCTIQGVPRRKKICECVRSN